MSGTSAESGGPEYVIIAGGGQFGTRAADYFESKGIRPLLVDQDAKCQAAKRHNAIINPKNLIKELGRETHDPVVVNAEIIDFIRKFNDLIGPKPCFLVPAVPIHLMGKLFSEWSEPFSSYFEGSTRAIDEILQCLEESDPRYWVQCNPSVGIAFTSFAPAGKTCPASCKGQLDYCHHRGETTREPLYSLLRGCQNRLPPNAQAWIFESIQLAPGVGGIPWGEIKKFFAWMSGLNANNLPQRVIVGTACNCHGVINEFQRKS